MPTTPPLTKEEQELIRDCACEKIIDEEFMRIFPRSLDEPHDLVRGLLEPCIHGGERHEVELVLLLGFVLEIYDESFASLLAELLLADHHTSHEDVAKLLQDLRVPDTVDALAKRCENSPPWATDLDGGAAVFRKCVWAIHDIGTADAKEALQTLTESTHGSVREYAERRLEHWNPGWRGPRGGL